ncbi:hypothetical protein F9K91_07695 [Brucella tritici]|uniref:Uncharacterized protein n=1 Tax=Brucella tritici TaxID=94626 RepID=A0A7X6FQ90_9HYPH|nr:hypothetical protein [Brucella tritici]KAB2666004.1 hypothetical protein F9K91_07695 [Brucella tritici]NKW09950.1 hypothetical protein [Brucella tritici]
MSVYRSITRMAAVCALNNYLEEPWPTLAGPYIFDSKIEPVEDMKMDRVFPCVVVYTDYDKDPWPKAGRVHEDRFMSLTFEMLVVQTVETDGVAEPYSLECPSTDSEIETTLDALEFQVFRALTEGTVASDAFNYLCPSYHNVVSRRGASVEGGLRLAARQVTVEMKAIRENATGVIPGDVQRFLDRLQIFPDYSERVGDIEALLTANAADSPNDRAMKTLGYTHDLAEKLGSPTGAQPLLTTPIVWYHQGIST